MVINGVLLRLHLVLGLMGVLIIEIFIAFLLLLLMESILSLKLLIADVVELLEDIYKHAFLRLYICFVAVTHKVHIHSPISSFLFLIEWSMERIIFIELVKVFIANFRCNLRNIGRSKISKFIPVQILKEWMSFNFVSTVPTESVVGVGNHSL